MHCIHVCIYLVKESVPKAQELFGISGKDSSTAESLVGRSSYVAIERIVVECDDGIYSGQRVPVKN